MRTLAEYVQGPVIDNQVELANARVTTSVMSLLEFLGCYFWKGRISEHNLNFSGDNKEDLYNVLIRQVKNVRVWRELP